MTVSSLLNGRYLGNSDKPYKTRHESLNAKLHQCHSMIYLMLKGDFSNSLENFEQHFFNAAWGICDLLREARRECEHLTAKDLMQSDDSDGPSEN